MRSLWAKPTVTTVPLVWALLSTSLTRMHCLLLFPSLLDTFLTTFNSGVYAGNVDFGGRAVAGYNAITNEPNTDLNGHGTHVFTFSPPFYFLQAISAPPSPSPLPFNLILRSALEPLEEKSTESPRAPPWLA